MTKMTQEKLCALIGGFLGKSPGKDNNGDLYVQLSLQIDTSKIQLESESEENTPKAIDAVVLFHLQDTDYGNHQQLEIICFAPRFPDKPYPLNLKEEQRPDAVRFCSQLPTLVHPGVSSSFSTSGFFYVKKGIEDPGMLPDGWLVEHWLKPYFTAVNTAFMLICKKFARI